MKLILILLCSIAFGAEKQSLVNADSVRMRASASAEAEIVSYLYKNMRVKPVEKKDDWQKVSSDGKEGWILSKFLSPDDSAAPDTYHAPADLAWFYARYGHGTSYESASLKLESFTVDEYRKLIVGVERGEYAAIGVVNSTLIAHLRSTPDDPKYQYLKKRLQQPSVGKSLAGYSESFLLLFPPEALAKNVELTKEVTYLYPREYFQYLPESIKTNKEFVLSIVRGREPAIYEQLDAKLKSDRQVIEAVAAWGFTQLYELDEKYALDTKLNLIALKGMLASGTGSVEILPYAHTALFDNEEFVLGATKILLPEGECPLMAKLDDPMKKKVVKKMAKINPACKESQ